MSSEPAVLQAQLTVPGVDDSILLLSVSTQEGLSQVPTSDVEIKLSGDEDPQGWLMRVVEVGFFDSVSGAVARRFSGVVTRIREHRWREESGRRVQLRIEAPLCRLRLTRDFRLFIDSSVDAIVRTLLEDAGIPADLFELRLTRAYPVREVRTQLHETSLDFLNRLLEEEGIFHFTEYGEGGPKTVFADDASSYADGEVPIVAYRSALGLRGEAFLDHLVDADALRPARYTLRDHDFKKPSLDLEVGVEGAAPLGREHYAYPGRYGDPAEGDTRARDLLAAADTGAQRIHGTGNVAGLVVGHLVEIEGAPGKLDGKWVITKSENRWSHQAERADIRVSFSAIRADATFRPPRITPKPEPRGPHLAKVRGPAGEEIHCDEHGRIKVAFVGDRRAQQDDKSSAWVRVSQMHTSGSVAIPRVGWEVLVDFENGDPDRPIVLGRVYNGVFLPPYQLPDGKTRTALKSESTPGGGGSNELRLEDAAGSEHFHVHAEKDFSLVVANNRTEKIAVDGSWNVGNNQTVDVGGDQTESIGASLELDIGAAQTYDVGGSRTKTVIGLEKAEIGGSRSWTIGGSHTHITPLTAAYTANGSLSETVGGSNIEAAAAAISTAVAGAATVSVAAACIQAAGSGKSDTTLGAHATTVGGALIHAAGGDISVGASAARAVTVGGAWAGNAAGDVNLTAKNSLSILVGGAVSMNAGTITLKVGGSKVTIGAGGVSIKSSTIKLTATGPHGELAPAISDK